MLGNVGAMGAYMMSHDATLGMSMLGTTTALSSIMGVTLTAAIGGYSYVELSCWLYAVSLKIAILYIHACCRCLV